MRRNKRPMHRFIIKSFNMRGLLVGWLIVVSPWALGENRLQQEGSPYLQQHATNPIHWNPWSEDVFDPSDKRLRFVSIGYSTCHWCHVMNRESFQSEQVGAVLNAGYLSIKVDREQHPDVDRYFTDLLTLSTGTAGWPINAILLPDGRPVIIQNYLTPEQLISLLQKYAEIWSTNPDSLALSSALYASISASARPLAETQLNFDEAMLEQIVTELLSSLDHTHGGSQSVQKFPDEFRLRFMLDVLHQAPNQAVEQALLLQLDQMLTGGLYDPVNGGFFRYSTQPDWSRPHFEKTLYNQAQLLYVYARAYRLTGLSRYLWVARDLVRFCDNWLWDSSVGGYRSAIDSEFNHVDGGYYLTQAEKRSQLKRQWLQALQLDSDVDSASTHALGGNAKADSWLSGVRSQFDQPASARPFIDDKVITAWNALMADSLLEFASISGLSPQARSDAISRAYRILSLAGHDPSGSALAPARFYNSAGGHSKASDEDLIFLQSAQIAAYRVSGDPVWLQRALSIQIGDKHSEPANASKSSVQSDRFKALIKEDRELPNPSAIALRNSWRLAKLSGDLSYRDRAERIEREHGVVVIEQPLNQLTMASTLMGQHIGFGEASGFSSRAIALMHSTSAYDSEGRCDGIDLHFNIAEGWHLSAERQPDGILKPLQIAIEDTVVLPKDILSTSSQANEIIFGGRKSLIYTNQARLQVPYAGCHQIARIKLTVQTCSDQLCLVPEPVFIVNYPTHPQHQRSE